VAPITRRLRRIEEPRLAAVALAIPILLMLAAYAFALTSVAPTPGGVTAAAGLVGIAGTGLLYAWRAVTGASSE